MSLKTAVRELSVNESHVYDIRNTSAIFFEVVMQPSEE